MPVDNKIISNWKVLDFSEIERGYNSDNVLDSHYNMHGLARIITKYPENFSKLEVKLATTLMNAVDVINSDIEDS